MSTLLTGVITDILAREPDMEVLTTVGEDVAGTVRGESIDEITGAVTVMRQKMTRIEAPEGAIDVCGTGGDGAFNIDGDF